MSRAAANSGKRARTLMPVDTGNREAVIRTHLSPRARQRSWSICDPRVGEKPGRCFPEKVLKDGLRTILQRVR